MIGQELYNRTVQILVDAYFKDELIHGKCHACAVGNIINNYKPFTKLEIHEVNGHGSNRAGWSKVFCTYNAHSMSQSQIIRMSEYNGKAKKQIDSTGYSVEELAKIEFWFETADKGETKEDYMFNGLMAVIDVLDEIHENKDTLATVRTKNKFVKEKIVAA